MKNTYKLMRKYLRLRGTLDALRHGKIDSIDRFGKKYTRLNRADFDAEILTPLSDQIFNLLKENLNKNPGKQKNLLKSPSYIYICDIMSYIYSFHF